MNLMPACGDRREALSGIRIWVFVPGRTWDFTFKTIKYRPDPTVCMTPQFAQFVPRFNMTPRFNTTV